MKDPNLYPLLCSTLLVFVAFALYLPRVTTHFSRRTRKRPPPRVLIVFAQVWFSLLALGCLAMLILPLFHSR